MRPRPNPRRAQFWEQERGCEQEHVRMRGRCQLLHTADVDVASRYECVTVPHGTIPQTHLLLATPPSNALIRNQYC